MNNITVTPGEPSGCSLPQLGVRGENQVSQVALDYSVWAEELGAGVVSLLVKRPGDVSAYPVALTIEDNVAVWTVNATDTAVPGMLRAEWIYTIGEKIAKTVVFDFRVVPDIGTPGDPPDPYETWLDTLIELGAETQQNAQDAAASAVEASEHAEAAEDAQEAAEAAQDAAETAQDGAEFEALKSEGYAVGKQNGVDVGSGSPYFENNSKFYAAAAQQSASEGGWVHFYIDEDGHLHYVKTPNVDLVFSLVNGHLHVTV